MEKSKWMLESDGVLVRDENGQVLLSSWRKIRPCHSVEEAEAEACLEGARLVAEWIRQPTTFEMDCSNMVNEIKVGTDTRSQRAGIIADILGVVRLLPEYRFQYVNRSSNQAAHLLAKRASECRECVVMRHQIPECIRDIVHEEGRGAFRSCIYDLQGIVWGAL